MPDYEWRVLENVDALRPGDVISLSPNTSDISCGFVQLMTNLGAIRRVEVHVQRSPTSDLLWSSIPDVLRRQTIWRREEIIPIPAEKYLIFEATHAKFGKGRFVNLNGDGGREVTPLAWSDDKVNVAR